MTGRTAAQRTVNRVAPFGRRAHSWLVVWILAGTAIIGPALAAPAARAWGGEGCAAVGDLRAAVDAALEVAPFGQGRGSGAPGFSVALEHDDCGSFAYAVGRRSLETGAPNQVSTRQHVGSLTKPVTTALTLILADRGLLGPRGIDARLADFLSKGERRLLTRGSGARRCPATILARDRDTELLVRVRAKCPKLKKITLRQLLNGNHGMWDFVNEVDRNGNGFTDLTDYLLVDLLEALDLDPMPLVERLDGPLGPLLATGLLQAGGARRGGRRLRDFEVSFGNTGHQLLGLVLERAAGRSYDELVEEHIVGPLGLGAMGLALTAPQPRGKVASEYGITTGADLGQLDGLDENLLGVYPLTVVNGHPALNLVDVGPIVLTNGGGGAGAVAAAPESYARFFHALVTGRLLNADAQRSLEDGFLQVEGFAFEHGFGLFRSTGALGVLITKGGATAGSNCFAAHSPESDGGNGATAVVCRNSADLFLEPALGLPASSAAVDSVTVDLLQLAVP